MARHSLIHAYWSLIRNVLQLIGLAATLAAGQVGQLLPSVARMNATLFHAVKSIAQWSFSSSLVAQNRCYSPDIFSAERHYIDSALVSISAPLQMEQIGPGGMRHVTLHAF